jgi:hypothetical protein
MSTMKYFKVKGNTNGYYSYNSEVLYTEDINYKFVLDEELKNGMRILISDCLKRKLSIKKLNKYFQNNNLDVKIVNKVELANTLCCDNNVYFRSGELIFDSTTNDPLYITNHYNTLPANTYSKQVIYGLYYNTRYDKYKKLLNLNNFEELLVLFDGTYTSISTNVLINISKEQHILESSNIEIDSYKLKTMLIDPNSCELICSTLKNKNLTKYIKDIILAYYLTNHKECRKLIKKQLLSNYKEGSYLTSLGDTGLYDSNHICYCRTMKQLGLDVDKEAFLEIAGYYKINI